MRKPLRLIGFLAICAVLLVPLGVLADDIAPSLVTGSFVVGGSTTIDKTVTVSAGTPTTAQTDIYFLTDSTGSMGGTINTVQVNAAGIMAATSALGNVQWAVGDYKDNGDVYVYRLDTAMTANQANVQAGINTWVASGGGDTPEANLYAVQQSTLAASGWRAGSTRILVQFGDAPGHDPSGPTNVTLAQATAALVGPPVTKLIAVDMSAKDSTGQETAMITAVNAVSPGSVVLHNPSQSALVAAVEAAISASFAAYHTVSLDLSGVPTGVTASYSGGVSGSWDRSSARSFDLGDLTFNFTAPGDYDFLVYALVDGGRVATEHEIFHVDPVPVPASLLLLGSGLLGLIPLRRKKLV